MWHGSPERFKFSWCRKHRAEHKFWSFIWTSQLVWTSRPNQWDYGAYRVVSDELSLAIKSKVHPARVQKRLSVNGIRCISRSVSLWYRSYIVPSRTSKDDLMKRSRKRLHLGHCWEIFGSFPCKLIVIQARYRNLNRLPLPISIANPNLKKLYMESFFLGNYRSWNGL